MRNLQCLIRLTSLLTVLFVLATAGVQANEDEWWGGYWRSYPGYNRPHPLRYAPYEQPTLYYGHAPPRTVDHETDLDGAGKSYDKYGNKYLGGPHIGDYHPFYGPGRYFGPSIDPYFAPGRARYGNRVYGWW